MIEPGFPCSYCGVRSDVPCRHRPAEAPRIAAPEPVDNRKTAKARENKGALWKLSQGYRPKDSL